MGAEVDRVASAAVNLELATAEKSAVLSAVNASKEAQGAIAKEALA